MKNKIVVAISGASGSIYAKLLLDKLVKSSSTRAADVILKERRKLILVARDTPLSLIHLQNMTTITQAGGIICPAIPSFYSQPKSIEELAETVVNRVIDLLGLEDSSYRWGEQ